MSLKRDSREVEVNHKVIEMYFDGGKWFVGKYDNDRLKYTEKCIFDSFTEADVQFDWLIEGEHEKMSYQC